MRKTPKVSIIVTANNYGIYLEECLESLLRQTYRDYEVVLINDGSTDNTEEVLKQYKDKVRIINLGGVGLAKAANAGIRNSKGKYIVRCDADDYFDENLLLVETDILDKKPDIGMVYPDYYRINQRGDIIEHVRLLKAGEEMKLLERSCLAAAAMYRKECFDAIDGYNEELTHQEDYDFWTRFTEKFKVYNVHLPLLYYRQHQVSMSANRGAMMEARRLVKKNIVEKRVKRGSHKILGVVLAAAHSNFGLNFPLREVAGKPLIYYTIKEALKCELIDKVIVSTEDAHIAKVAKSYKAEVIMRPVQLTKPTVSVQQVLKVIVEELNSNEGYKPDVVVSLQVLSPLRTERHITEAIDTLFLYKADSVISVVEDLSFHWQPWQYGLRPVGYQKALLRKDRETTYKETGAVYVCRVQNLYKENMLGERVGYIEMLPHEAIRTVTDFDFWVAEQMILSGKFNSCEGDYVNR